MRDYKEPLSSHEFDWTEDELTAEISKLKQSKQPPLDLNMQVQGAREGYTFATLIDSSGLECIEYVNKCPYGPAWSGTENESALSALAHAWYHGWWFYWYVIKPWKLLFRTK